MKTFYAILGNSLAASVVNNFVWFAVTFWVFLQTKSVIATSIMAGVFTVTIALSGFFLGSLVDRYRKKSTMLLSSVTSLVLYVLAAVVFLAAPPEFLHRCIECLPVGLYRANPGRSDGGQPAWYRPVDTGDDHDPGRESRPGERPGGTANGVAFMAASIFSGLAVGFLGVPWMLGSPSG